MPKIVIISASEVSQRRLLSDTLQKYAIQGYSLSGRKEGGSWQDILSLGKNRVFFSEKQMLLVENAENLGVLPESMITFFNSVEESSLVLLVYDGSPSKYIPKEALQRAEILKAEEIPFWPSARLRWLLNFCGDRRINLEKEAAALLIDWIEDGEELRSEIEKIAAFSDGQTVTSEMVRALSFDEGRSSMLRFLDGVCQGNQKEILILFPHLHQDVPFLMLVTALYNRLKPVIYQYIFPSLSEKDILEMLKVRSYAGKMASEARKNYDKQTLFAFIVELTGLSYGEKTGAGAGWAGLETIVLRLIGSIKKEKS